MKYNPYYSPDELSLQIITFDQPNLSYEYDTLCFWVTQDGLIYSASDSGCSCPTPFEDYAGNDQQEVLSKLERIGSIDQGIQIFDSWNQDHDNRKKVSSEERDELSSWLNKYFR